MWDDLRGHQRTLELFRQAFRRERSAHAYLLIGPEGIGKRTFAFKLSQCLFCERTGSHELDACGECHACKQMQAGTHPDLLSIARPDGKRELPIELIVGSSDRRGREGLCHELAMRPMSADRRIAIIDDAQTMNAASANALLKTLEEPPPGSILFLLTPSVDAILPTIRSRCQPVTFTPLPDEDLAELITSQGLSTDAEEVQQITTLAGGSLVTAQQLLHPVLRELRERLFRALGERELDPFATTSQVLTTLDALGGDPATQRRHAGWIVRFCVEFFRNELRSSQLSDPEDPLAEAPELDRLAAQMERCIDAELQLQQSMPLPLCLEGLFDELSRLRRGRVPA
ncbi:MAG: DNA polymerase III subunit delta' [Planctomycetaceae bacterium]|nr:DNA polymerase III subunit delta' [Planctomycetaceae bacterium]